MATLTKKHMLFGAELVARRYREAKRLSKQGDSRNAWLELVAADALRGGFHALFASFNNAYSRDRFFDACEPPTDIERNIISEGQHE